MLEAMVRPSRMVIRFARVVCAVWDRLSSLRHSRSRLPNISIPTRETEAGATSPEIIITQIGNRMRVLRETDCGLYGIRIIRSFLVVTALMANGWMIGTSAMYA